MRLFVIWSSVWNNAGIPFQEAQRKKEQALNKPCSDFGCKSLETTQLLPFPVS